MSRRQTQQKLVVEVKGPSQLKQRAQNSNKNKNKKRNRKNRNRSGKIITKQSAPMEARPLVKHCTINYAKALANPHDPTQASDVCLPDDLDQPSFKFHSRARGIAAVGTQGFGFVMASPLAMGNAALSSHMASTSSYPSSTIVLGGAAGTTLSGISNSPFSDLQGLLPSMRNVICSLRIRYTGTELNRGGTVVPFKTKQLVDSDDALGLSYTSALLRGSCTSNAVSRKWETVTFTPITGSDKNYFELSDQWQISSPSGVGLKLGFLFTGTPGNTFEYEVVSYFEAIPTSRGSGQTYAPPSVSPSETDLPGYSFIKDVYTSVSDNVSGPQLWNFIQQAAKAYSSGEVPFPRNLPLTWV